MAYHVYMLECSDGTYFTGITSNLEKRLLQHKSGYYRDSYTHTRRPVKLVWIAAFTNVHCAIRKEKQLKKWSNKKKRALIEEDWDRVSELSKKVF